MSIDLNIQPYHLVTTSPWPILLSLVFSLCVVLWLFHNHHHIVAFTIFIITVTITLILLASMVGSNIRQLLLAVVPCYLFVSLYHPLRIILNQFFSFVKILFRNQKSPSTKKQFLLSWREAKKMTLPVEGSSLKLNMAISALALLASIQIAKYAYVILAIHSLSGSYFGFAVGALIIFRILLELIPIPENNDNYGQTALTIAKRVTSVLLGGGLLASIYDYFELRRETKPTASNSAFLADSMESSSEEENSVMESVTSLDAGSSYEPKDLAIIGNDKDTFVFLFLTMPSDYKRSVVFVTAMMLLPAGRYIYVLIKFRGKVPEGAFLGYTKVVGLLESTWYVIPIQNNPSATPDQVSSSTQENEANKQQKAQWWGRVRTFAKEVTYDKFQRLMGVEIEKKSYGIDKTKAAGFAAMGGGALASVVWDTFTGNRERRKNEESEARITKEREESSNRLLDRQERILDRQEGIVKQFVQGAQLIKDAAELNEKASKNPLRIIPYKPIFTTIFPPTDPFLAAKIITKNQEACTRMANESFRNLSPINKTGNSAVENLTHKNNDSDSLD